MFWNTLDQPQKPLLTKLAASLPVPGSYLAGGTALALILGHRKSVDLDWFTPLAFHPDPLIQNLSVLGKVKVAEIHDGTFHGFVDGVRVTWLYYPNPLLQPWLTVDEAPGLRLASLTDLAVMKWTALSQRGARKDFIDLYFLSQHGYDLRYIINLLPQKYPGVDINRYHMIKSLSYFDDAEREVMPVMIHNLKWSTVKEFFLSAQKTFLRELTNGS